MLTRACRSACAIRNGTRRGSMYAGGKLHISDINTARLDSEIYDAVTGDGCLIDSIDIILRGGMPPQAILTRSSVLFLAGGRLRTESSASISPALANYAIRK